jgi:hypothetical protein
MRMKNQLYDLEDLSQFCGFGTIFGPYLWVPISTEKQMW